MSKDRHANEFKHLIDDADRLLEELDGVRTTTKGTQSSTKTKESSPEVQHSNKHRDEGGDQSSHALAITGCLALGGVIISAIIASQNPNTTRGVADGKDLYNSKRGGVGEQALRHKADFEPEPTQPESHEEVRFNGIDLPITNKLCNKRGSFCISGLARLVQAESGEADYTFEDIANGQMVSIKGRIGISELRKSANGTREFTFWFRDHQSHTTPGWAAAGFFKLDQDQGQPGILTRFTTTESFGPKTPVGLENKSYLFPS